jgi:hypothetical protein
VCPRFCAGPHDGTTPCGSMLPGAEPNAEGRPDARPDSPAPTRRRPLVPRDLSRARSATAPLGLALRRPLHGRVGMQYRRVLPTAECRAEDDPPSGWTDLAHDVLALRRPVSRHRAPGTEPTTTSGSGEPGLRRRRRPAPGGTICCPAVPDEDESINDPVGLTDDVTIGVWSTRGPARAQAAKGADPGKHRCPRWRTGPPRPPPASFRACRPQNPRGPAVSISGTRATVADRFLPDMIV